MNIIRNTTALAMHTVSSYIKEGDTVIDATCGGGHDTLALSQLVGESGKVYGFDIQEDAIRRTEELLKTEGAPSEIVLVCAGHEHMTDFVDEEVSVIMFNLGYLPGADKNITTMTDTSLCAIETAANIIRKDGIVSVTMYPGHSEGAREREALIDWAKKLDKSKFHVAYTVMINQDDISPEILMVTRKK